MYCLLVSFLNSFELGSPVLQSMVAADLVLLHVTCQALRSNDAEYFTSQSVALSVAAAQPLKRHSDGDTRPTLPKGMGMPSSVAIVGAKSTCGRSCQLCNEDVSDAASSRPLRSSCCC